MNTLSKSQSAPGNLPGLVVSAPASGQGKTLVTMGLLRALRRAGWRPAPAKAGPDYIDPAFHAAAAGRPCLTLDPWGMRPATLRQEVERALAEGADFALAEGAMGLFDGARDGTGSTADLAARFGWPVVLAVSARGMGATAAAIARGLRNFRADVRVAGVLFNQVGGPGHEAILRRAMEDAADMPVLGCLPRVDGLRLPSRHLGLVQAAETEELERIVERAADWVAAHVDMDALTALIPPRRQRPPASATADDAPPIPPPISPLGQRIAVARDEAFSFLYPHVLAGWRRAGAALSFFSPLADEGPDADADAVWLAGGYPELRAGRLTQCAGFMGGLRRAAARGAWIMGECGGYMALGEGLVDADGARHRMAGLLPLETSMAKGAAHLRLGYRWARLLRDCPLGRAGTRLRAHEFHYAAITREDVSRADRPFHATDACRDNAANVGLRAGTVMGSFLHFIDTYQRN